MLNTKKSSDKFDPTDKCFTLRLHPTVIWIGIICSVFFIGLIILSTVVFPNKTSTIWVELEFGIFAILGALLALYGFKYKIVFLEDKIIKYSMLRKNQIFISSITQIEMVQDNLKIYSNDKKVFSYNDGSGQSHTVRWGKRFFSL